MSGVTPARQHTTSLHVRKQLFLLHGYYKMRWWWWWFFSSTCRSFHNAILFGSCNINILNTGCAKILNKIPPQHIHLLNILNMLLHKLSREIRLAKRPWSVGVFTFHYFKLYFHLRLCLLRGLFPSGSPTKLMNF